jgi:N-acetylglucosamine-6-phosphate deacetylase
MSWNRHAVVAETVFDGEVVHRGCAVLIEDGRVAALLPEQEVLGLRLERLPAGAWLVPGFVDLQVNGGGDVLLNDEPTPEGVAAIAAAHRRFGTTSLLPTLISDTDEVMGAALAAVEAARLRDPGVLGIHLEGPFLSPEKVGAHDPAHLRRPRAGDLERLTAQRRGITLVTLAPEEVPAGFIRQLAAAGVKVSLGHSMATYAQTRAALAEGISGFTHLFNAMRPLSSREGGPIAAALETPSACFGLIVDGVHVAPEMLRLALRGAGQPMLVTDAMPPVGGRQPGFRLDGREITVRDGRCTTADGTLAGSVLDMASAVRNAVRLLGLPLPGALAMATARPAAFLGLADQVGRLAPGCRADMVALDPAEVAVLRVFKAGSSEP